MNIDSPITMPHSIASRYEVLECIGQGGMGLVYRGIGLEDNREVAIKVIDPKHLTEPGCRRGFIREARAILRLRHPNVVELIDFDAPHQDAAFLVTEFICGGNMGQWREHWPGWTALLQATDCVLAALGYAHARSIVHCDIKPENVLLTMENTGIVARLADFGVARLAAHSYSNLGSAQWRTDELTGTPTYMAPEQAEGYLGAFGAWTDLYSLGVVLYEILVGAPPFESTSVTGILIKQMQEDAPPMRTREGVPELAGFAEIVRRMLCKDPWDRPRFATTLRDELAGFIEQAKVLDEGCELAGLDDFVSMGNRPTGNIPAKIATLPSTGRVHNPWTRQETQSTGLKALRTRDIALVSRTDELQTLVNASQCVLRDQTPYVVLLHGPAGIGKSRLAQALREVLEESGEMQTWSGSYRVEAGLTTAGLRGAIEAFYLCLGLGRERTAEVLAERLERLGATDPWERNALLDWFRPKDHERAHLSDASVVGLCLRAAKRASRRHPLYIWLDDVHNAFDFQVLAFVERLLGQIPTPDDERHPKVLPALVVLSYRDLDDTSDPTGTSRERLQRLAVHERVSELTIGTLSDFSITKLLVEEVGLPNAQAKRIAQQCDGKPFLALQAARATVELDDLRQRGSSRPLGPCVVSNDDFELTEPSRPIIVSPLSSGRLLAGCLRDALEKMPSPSGLRVLGMAALLGPRISLPILRTALDAAWPDEPWASFLPTILRDSAAAGLLDDDGENDMIELSHQPLTRLLSGELARVGDATTAHQAAAEALRRHFGDVQGRAASDRARHLFMADCRDDAWALMRSAIDEAVEHNRYGNAVSLAKELRAWLDEWKVPLHAERRGEIQRALAWAAIRCGALIEAAKHIATEKKRRTNQTSVLAERALLQGELHDGRGELALAVRAFELARVTYQKLGDKKHACQARLGLAKTLRAQGELDQALKEAEEALAGFASVRDVLGRAASLRVLGQIYVLGNNLERAQTSYEQALALYSGNVDLHGTADAQRGLGGLFVELGDAQRGRDLLEEAQKGYETVGDLHGVAHCWRGIARTRRMRGQVDVAIALLDKAAKLFEQLGSPLGAAACHLDLASILRSIEDFTSATDHLEAAVESYQRAQDERGVASCLTTLGNVLLDAGHVHLAIERHEQALKMFWRTGYQPGVLLARLNLGHAHMTAGHFDKAKELLLQVETDARKAKDWVLSQTAAAYLALSDAKAGDFNAARESFKRAVNKRYNVVSEEIGVALERLSEVFGNLAPDELDFAVEALREAERHFEQVGQRASQRRASRNRVDLASKMGDTTRKR